MIIFCSPVNFFFFTPKKREKKSEKLQLRFYFFCGKISPLGNERRGLQRRPVKDFFWKFLTKVAIFQDREFSIAIFSHWLLACLLEHSEIPKKKLYT